MWLLSRGCIAAAIPLRLADPACKASTGSAVPVAPVVPVSWHGTLQTAFKEGTKETKAGALAEPRAEASLKRCTRERARIPP